MVSFTYKIQSKSQINVAIDPWSEAFTLAPDDDIEVSCPNSESNAVEVGVDRRWRGGHHRHTHVQEISGGGFERKYQV